MGDLHQGSSDVEFSIMKQDGGKQEKCTANTFTRTHAHEREAGHFVVHACFALSEFHAMKKVQEQARISRLGVSPA